MKRLPLYSEEPRAAVELEAPLAVNHGCTRCELGQAQLKPKRVCMTADGEPGGLLVVGQAPGKEEDSIGRPFMGAASRYFRLQVARLWKGPVAYDYAVRCYPGGKVDPPDKSLAACRGYLTETLREVRPQRVLTLGGFAARSVLGRSLSPLTMRRAYGYMRDPYAPVYSLLHPGVASRNRFYRTMLEEDLQWALTGELPEDAPLDAQVKLVTTLEDALACESAMRLWGWCSFDVETAGIMWEASFRILCVSFCGAGESSPWVWTKAAFADPAVRAVLFRLLEDPTLRKGGANVKYDQLAFKAVYGLTVHGVDFDVRLERKLLEPESSGYLEDMVELVGMGGMKDEVKAAKAVELRKIQAALRAEVKHAKSGNLSLFAVPETVHPKADKLLDAVIRADPSESDRYVYGLLPDNVLYNYNGRDSVGTTRLKSLFSGQLAEPKNEGLKRVWDQIVLPASGALAQVEAWGMGASRDAMLAFDSYLGIQEMEASAKLQRIADINWGSTDQLVEFFYRTKGYAALKMTDGGTSPSVDEESLEFLVKSGATEAGDVLKLREVRHLRGTYAAGLIKHIRSDGRIHPNVLLDGARSGRTSCSAPNLQNVPRADTTEGHMIRQCFIAPEGYVLLESDYSQLELRIAALLSGDPEMKSVFASGVDYHLRTAQLIAKIAWGITPEQVESIHRSVAKTINFALLYGQGDIALAAKITSEMRKKDPRSPGIKPDEVGRVREAILGRFKVLSKWLDGELAFARKHGYSQTWWAGKPGRRRPLWSVADEDDKRRSNAENASQNTPIQGTASEYCLASLVGIVRWIQEEKVPAKVTIPIHDSVMIEVRKDYLSEAAYCVKEIMQGHYSGDVLLKVDQKVGPNWADLEKYKEDELAA